MRDQNVYVHKVDGESCRTVIASGMCLAITVRDPTETVHVPMEERASIVEDSLGRAAYELQNRVCPSRDTEVARLLVFCLWTSLFVPGHMYGWAIERGYCALICLVSVVIASRVGIPRRGCGGMLIDPVKAMAVLLSLQLISLLAYLHRVCHYSAAIGLRDLLEVLRPSVRLLFGLVICRATSRSITRAVDSVIPVSLGLSSVVFVSFAWPMPVLTGVLKGFLYANTKTV